MPRRLFPPALPALIALAIAVPLVAREAPAATGYSCGDGKPNLTAKRCDCPSGKVELTNAKGTSTCVDAPKPPVGSASIKPVASAKPPASAQPASKCPAGMAAVPAGTFKLDETKATMKVAAFCVDVNEVTVDDYTSCVAKNACAKSAVYSDDPKLGNQGCNLGRPGRGLHPINCISYEEASSYCTFAKKRLPTDEEWEWVARNGDDGSRYPWGAAPVDETRANVCGAECPEHYKGFGDHPLQAMFKGDDGFAESAPVGSFPKGQNKLGVNDLAGNVWEWTSTSDVGADGVARKIVRGGGFLSEVPMLIQTGTRGAEKADTRTWQFGVRCAKSI
jgi:formylglycine-generating enzyme required for sulfatase activity